MIFRVLPHNVTRLWPDVSPLLAEALAMTITHDDDDVRMACMGGSADLWVQWEEGAERPVEAAFVTTFSVYPRGSWVRMWLIGCRPDKKFARDEFIKELDEWRTVNKCRGVEYGGRPGWAKLYPQGKIEGLVIRWTEGLCEEV